MGLVGGLKNSEMLTDAYGGVGGWVKKLEMLTDAYGGVGGWVGLKHLHTY